MPATVLPGRRALWGAILLLCLQLPAAKSAAAALPEPATPLLLGGLGGVYFFAEPGELVVEVEKRDRNRRDVRTELRALLLGPDRQLLQETVIPDDGQPRGGGLGPPLRTRLSTRVTHRGVYVLNLTVSQDRYGEEAVWSFRTNCAKYLIETARGHKDARHEEPIVLASPDRPADVCFRPRPGAFTVELSDLPERAAAPQLFDASGRLLATLALQPNGRATGEVGARTPRDHLPWRLHLPAAQATLRIDGVTRWDAADANFDKACWTTDPTAWFPLLENRWLLTPYHHLAYGRLGADAPVTFTVRNDSPRPRTVRLALEFPAGAWPVTLSTSRVTLAPRSAVAVVATATVPATGPEHTVHLRATPEDDSGFSTFSTLVVRAGEAPATQSLAIPLVLQAYRQENAQFGYAPDFPVDNQIYFDRRNQPFVLTAAGVATLRDGRWATTRPGTAGGLSATKVAFDRHNNVYVLGSAGRITTLYYSADGGRTFGACPIPGRNGLASTFDLEQFSGHNQPDGPPPILRFTRTAKDEKLFWRALHDLELFLPRKEGDRVVLGEPILITRQCIGQASHSGIPSSVVSRGSKVHIVWGEATDPAAKVPGVPAYAVTYDCATGRLGQPAFLGHGAPANDIHNTPSLTMDGEGYLHVLGGTHGRPFPYARSLQPNDAGAGWTDAVPLGENLGQTYVGLVCGPDNTLHAVFRLWRSQTAPFPASSHATLAYQRKRPGQPWEPPRILVVAPFSEYSVFYHRLTIDRLGRLFVSYDYWSTFWFYRNDLPASRRTVLVSPDTGETWKLAATADLATPAP
jgi:hypothetical protein